MIMYAPCNVALQNAVDSMSAGLPENQLRASVCRKSFGEHAYSSVKPSGKAATGAARCKNSAADLFGYTQFICYILTINWTYRLALRKITSLS